jgi:hypothetical protein
MRAFDPWGYLRMLGDTELARDTDSPWAGPIDDAARALVAVGAIASDDAREVLAEYGRTLGDAQDDRTLGQGRVVGLHAEVRLPSGTLRLSHARLGTEETAIAASYRADPRHRRIHEDWIRVPSGWPSGLRSPLLADDRGERASLTFHGSGNDDSWRATLTADPPIAPDTAWLELWGARIACIDDGPTVRTAIEQLDNDDPAHTHLWRCLARSATAFDQALSQATIEALIASGALGGDDPVLEQVEAVRRRLPRRHEPQTRPTAFRGLPAPWPSLIGRRAKTDGPTGLVLIAVKTPEFSGHRVAVDVLQSGADRFTVTARESPTPEPGSPFRGSLEDRELIWWARDDRSNHYLAGRSNDRLQFTTPLDPLATSLELMPTAVDGRAVISVPLEWVTSDA